MAPTLALAATLALALLASWGFLVLGLSLFSWLAMARRPVRDAGDIESLLVAKGEIQPAWLGLPWLEARVMGPGGYEVSVHALQGRRDALALVHHGVGWNWLAGLKYADILLREGWTVVLPDSRGHGASGGRGTSFGVHESADIGAVLSWARSSLDIEAGAPTLLFGVSLGAASVLEYAPGDPAVAAIVADSPFSGAEAILDWKLSRLHVPAFLRRPVLGLTDLLLRRLEGFSLFEARPDLASLASPAPILFVHGGQDGLVPASMSEAMAGARRAALPGALTELLLVPGAGHARAHRLAPALYEARVLAFLARALGRPADHA